MHPSELYSYKNVKNIAIVFYCNSSFLFPLSERQVYAGLLDKTIRCAPQVIWDIFTIRN